MPIILSQTLVLNPGTELLNTPIFGWNNLLPNAIVTATTEESGFPVSNLSNPSTALRWKGLQAQSPFPITEFITATFAQAQELTYLAVAAHNLGTWLNTVSVEYFDLNASPQAWVTLVEEHIFSNNDPIIFRFETKVITQIRLKIQGSQLANPDAPFIAVMHVGKLLVMPRGTHQDHVPINLGIESNIMTGRSETGNYIGRVTLSEQRATSIAFQRLDPTFYRDNIHPFVKAARTDPFFFAWKPQEFPNDVGYCWLTNDVQPSRHFDTGTMSLTLNMNGVTI